MKRVAVFASGSGSNFESLVEASRQSNLGYEVVLLVTDRLDAYALERASRLNIPTKSFAPKAYATKGEYEIAILTILKQFKIDWIALAGYMRLVGSTLLEPYQQRIVNIHPSLLPHFPGKDAIGQALKAEVAQTGVTVHYIDEGIDTGPVISQEIVAVRPEDTYETLQKRIKQVEHHIYPKTLAKIMREDELNVSKTRVN
ncbi:phosphoribosylglycinamide formyltransferase [Alkalibacillus aidingensis]|uniref:phosphoribosylglycinamide formyltransferase n=1 Tax=Alkalibacillus aidingensis TaxID=2747607 RepID=UPI0016605EE4|nr:phosphoribosylglycinamide formyltransferase [Alkalibacillus aidingensis]